MNIYKVEKAKEINEYGVIDERYFITENKLPMVRICLWLDNVSINSPLTGKHYANCLLGFLRYIDELGLNYKQIRTKSVIWNYMKKLIYENKKERTLGIEPKKSYNSIYHIIKIICNFYYWLDEYSNGIIDVKKLKSFDDIDNKYIYKEIWGTKFFQRTKHLAPFRVKTKKRRDSYRWYTTEELECFMTSFNSKRDLAIFLISVEGGCRIEEILTIKHYDYNSNENRVWISESKTIKRYVYLPQYVCNVIDDYLNTEKFETEIKLDRQLDEYLFINIKAGKSQGKKVRQDNYRTILKRAAKRIGLNPNKVITHAGRSTKAQDLIEQNCSDFEIMEIMGWSSIETVKSYRKEFSPEFAKSISEKVYKRKRLKKDEQNDL